MTEEQWKTTIITERTLPNTSSFKESFNIILQEKYLYYYIYFIVGWIWLDTDLESFKAEWGGYIYEVLKTDLRHCWNKYENDFVTHY